MRTLTLLSLFVIGVCAGAQPSHGQDQPGGGSQRLTYSVKHGSAKSLAPVLAKHFKGAAEIQAVPDSPENALLISAPPAVLKEVVTLLQQLDRKARQIAVDVWVGVVFADGAAPKATDAAAAKPKDPDQQLDLREFTGPATKIFGPRNTRKTRQETHELRFFIISCHSCDSWFTRRSNLLQFGFLVFIAIQDASGGGAVMSRICPSRQLG